MAHSRLQVARNKENLRRRVIRMIKRDERPQMGGRQLGTAFNLMFRLLILKPILSHQISRLLVFWTIFVMPCHLVTYTSLVAFCENLLCSAPGDLDQTLTL